MGDRNRHSASEELLGRARGEASAEELGSDGFSLESPVDDYWSSAQPEELSVDAADMSAEEIAAALLAANASNEVVDDLAREPEISEPDLAPAGADSLPSWATDEPTPLTAESVREALAAEDSSVATETPSRVEGDEWVPSASWDDASPEWLEREAAMAAKNQRRFDVPVPRLRTFISLGVLLLVALPVLIGIFDGKEAIQEAGVGDCFVSDGAIEIDQVALLDCTELHDTEVFAVVDATSLGSSYPGEDPLFDWLFDECLDRFTGYTGESYQTSRYWIDAFIPTNDAWRLGDNEGLCTLVVLDDDMDIQLTTGSGRDTTSA